MINMMIEQLDELGRVEVGDLTMEKIEEIKRDLDLQGYVTKFQSTDKDYLVLVEKKPRAYCIHHRFYEGDTNIVEVMSEDEFNRYCHEDWEDWDDYDYTSFTSLEEFEQYEELYFVDDKLYEKMKKILMEGKYDV
jgi:hypothetical protein